MIKSFSALFWKNKIKLKFHTWIRSGLHPLQLAKTMAVAIMVSIFPVYGVTTVMLVLISLRLKMNLAVLVSTSYLFTPVQLLLMPIFFKSGYALFDPATLKNMHFETLITERISHILETFGWGLAYGVILWTLVAPFLGFIIYMVLSHLFCKTRVLSKLKSFASYDVQKKEDQVLRCG
ncbi:DUF2062 domain-containing protein [Fontibacter flavus]|uniref:DUF2062 domain-containing protein n=1 Tax=Fontibacter flavus TaxID=654838 RepID=A0ABV6FV96_9BACT